MSFGGYDLLHISHNESNKTNFVHFNLTKKMLSTNLKMCFKNLFVGLLKMHNNRIVNRDIKTENIMINYDETTKLLDLRFIDFGLSTLIPTYYKKREYVNYHGTEGCISPELIISYYIMNGESYEDTMININKYIKRNLASYKNYELIEKYKILEYFNSDIKDDISLTKDLDCSLASMLSFISLIDGIKCFAINSCIFSGGEVL